jgi:hypothetical protein
MTDMSTFATTLVASAFGGGLVAGLFAIYNRLAGKKDEHEKWLRDQKVEAYGSYINSSDLLVLSFSALRAEHVTREDSVQKFADAQLSAVELLAPPAVREAGSKLDAHVVEMFQDALWGTMLEDDDNFDEAIEFYTANRKEFLRLVQHDLDIHYPDHPVGGSKLGVKR